MSGYLVDPETDVAAMGVTFTLVGQAFLVVSGVAGEYHDQLVRRSSALPVRLKLSKYGAS